MSEFQSPSKQNVDPLADAKAWLAHMEKALAKLAEEHVGPLRRDQASARDDVPDGPATACQERESASIARPRMS
jgi:hypothetical protein